MTQGERIKEVRNSLGLTLEKFGEKLGVTKTAISRLEKGGRSLTEQMTKSICREFGVDYIWLTTGDGEMFVDNDDELFEKIDRILADESDFRRDLFKSLVNASDDDILALKRLIESVSIKDKA
nr:helix-turn-helix domain-containing protein [uncultured Blautia sp.]